MIVLQTIAVAFAMFSAVPVPQFAWNEKNMRYALCAFPLVGLLCGVLWCVCGVLPLPAPARAAGILQGLDALAAQCENLVIVSNEVFSGGADYAGDTDRYLLALAQVNNALAARADAVVRVVCGIPVYYKGVEK